MHFPSPPKCRVYICILYTHLKLLLIKIIYWFKNYHWLAMCQFHIHFYDTTNRQQSPHVAQSSIILWIPSKNAVMSVLSSVMSRVLQILSSPCLFIIPLTCYTYFMLKDILIFLMPHMIFFRIFTESGTRVSLNGSPN